MWTPEYLRAHLQAFLDEYPNPHGWPRAAELDAAGRADLRIAMKHHGGATFWAREFGRTLEPRQERSPYVDADARADAESLIREHGAVPGSAKCRALGYARLAGYFRRFDGRRREALEYLGLPTALPRPTRAYSTPESRRRLEHSRAERDAWALDQAQRVVAELGFMPGARRLRGMGLNSLAAYVDKAGGARAFAARHRLPVERRSR